MLSMRRLIIGIAIIWMAASIYFQSICLALSILFATFCGFWLTIGRKYGQLSNKQWAWTFGFPIIFSMLLSVVLLGSSISWGLGGVVATMILEFTVLFTLWAKYNGI